MGKHPWLDEYLLSKAGCTKDYKEEWDWHRYFVGGKMFAALLHPSENYDPIYAGKDLISLKCDKPKLLKSVLWRTEIKNEKEEDKRR